MQPTSLFLLLLVAVGASSAGAQPVLTPSSRSVVPDGAITLTVTSGPANPTDRVGLFQVGAKSAYPIAWSYLDGTQTAPASGLVTATLVFTMPRRPTTYEFRFFAAGSDTPSSTSTGVLVRSPSRPPDPATPLPFDPLQYEIYHQQTRKVVSHHHNFTTKQDNLDGDDPDEWWNRAITDGFSDVQGVPCDGGGVRSRPYPMPPLDNYAVDRWLPELEACKAAGVDIVFVNMQPLTGSGGTRRDRQIEALKAAEIVGGIEIALNFDYDGGVDPVDAAAWIRDNVFSRPAYARAANGRYYVGAFMGSDNADEQAWHRAFVNACAAQGTPVAYVPTVNYDSAIVRQAFNELGTAAFPGYGGWGNARSLTADATREADEAWANGNRFYLWPDRPQQYRTKSSSYVWDESAGPRQFVNIFERAIAYKTPSDPLWVQLLTGSDCFEGTEVWPSTSHNFFWMDLTAWFDHALKLGTYPTIVRDCIMYCHRTQHHTLRGHSDRHTWTFPWNITDPESNIYAVVFPTNDATVEVSFAGRTEAFPVPGGVMSIVSMPFAADESGTPEFKLIRNSAPIIDILSNYPIETSLAFTDPEYKAGSSLRPGTYTSPRPEQIEVPPGDPATHLANLSTRGIAEDGASALIGGFVISGPSDARKDLLIRGVAASLLSYSVDGVLRKPALSLFNGKGELLERRHTQDTYHSDGSVDPALAAAGSRAGAFALQTQPGLGLPSIEPSGDTALLVTLPPGLYTAMVTPDTDTLFDSGDVTNPVSSPDSGVVLLEVYDLAPDSPAVLENLSTRGKAEHGARQLIVGFVVNQADARLLVRAVGPGIAPFGVPEVLADPALQLYDSDGHVITANEDWGNAATTVQAALLGRTTGAFDLRSGTKDAALVIRLRPGRYTMIVSASDPDASGNVLAEAYLTH